MEIENWQGTLINRHFNEYNIIYLLCFAFLLFTEILKSDTSDNRAVIPRAERRFGSYLSTISNKVSGKPGE